MSELQQTLTATHDRRCTGSGTVVADRQTEIDTVFKLPAVPLTVWTAEGIVQPAPASKRAFASTRPRR